MTASKTNLLLNLQVRSKISYYIRQFFYRKNFTQVETPILVPSLIPESYLEYFKTTLITRRGNKKTMYLTASPESSLKKLLSKGLGNCFEITKSFRNTETDSYLHNPEFTILEWYRINADYKDIMKDCEELFLFLLKKLNLPHKLIYQGIKVDLTPPWERITLFEAFKKYTQIDLISCLDEKSMQKKALQKGYRVSSKTTWEELFNQMLLNEIEPHLGTHGHPTILYDYPASEAALARKKAKDPRFAERFELYIAGFELGDCYSELIDPQEQRLRFTKEQKLRQKKGKQKISPDLDFLASLKRGLPSCSGIAVGLDRLCMLLTDSPKIQDVLAFPYQNQ